MEWVRIYILDFLDFKRYPPSFNSLPHALRGRECHLELRGEIEQGATSKISLANIHVSPSPALRERDGVRATP